VPTTFLRSTEDGGGAAHRRHPVVHGQQDEVGEDEADDATEVVAAGYAIEILFGTGAHPGRARHQGDGGVGHPQLHDRAERGFLILAAVLVVRFLRTDGRSMLRMMKAPAHEQRHD
jgi:hypothetical protein